jgi:hypothetical protein
MKGRKMALQFEIGQSGGPPPGIYRAVFKDVEKTGHDEYGDRLNWLFEVETGDHAGETASRITGPKPTPKNAAGRMISGITGQSLAAGRKLDLVRFVGKTYLLQVAETKNGATRVETVMPAEGAAG